MSARRRQDSGSAARQPRPTTLTSLPPEILLQIISYAQTARFLRDLSLTCRTLKRSVEEEGWRAFTLARFPSFETPPYWKDAAHSLTTLSRNFDRRAFIASRVFPVDQIHTLPDGGIETRWQRPRGQTMGYRPVIDSYDCTESSWRARTEVLAWGAGAKLVMNRAVRDDTLRQWSNAPSTAAKDEPDSGYVINEWITYKEADQTEGHDDITTVNLIPSNQLPNTSGDGQLVVTGRASGELALLSLSPGAVNSKRRRFDTRGNGVQSADITIGQSPLLAASLGKNDQTSLYRLDDDSESTVQPSSVVTHSSSQDPKDCSIWSTRFISTDKLAVGRGPSENIVNIYSVRPSGLSEQPIRSFLSSIGGKTHKTSAHTIIPVPHSSNDRQSNGNLILSGGYDSLVRLHDLRSPEASVMILRDPVDLSAIFSLAAVGRERVVAGGATYGLLKFFDMRMTGGRIYNYEEAMGTSHRHVELPSQLRRNNEFRRASGWNLFGLSNSHGSTSRRPSTPVYSLSRPSASSPNLYAGMENAVLHLNFTSPTDNHPDPRFENSVYRDRYGSLDIRRSWDKRNVVDLISYEQVVQGACPMLHQRKIREVSRKDASLPGFDSRWTTAIKDKSGIATWS